MCVYAFYFKLSGLFVAASSPKKWGFWKLVRPNRAEASTFRYPRFLSISGNSTIHVREALV